MNGYAAQTRRLVPVGLQALLLLGFASWSAAQEFPRYTIATIAGNGAAAFAGDAGAATSASLNTPGGMAYDSNGNLFIADTFNHRIRRVAPDGTITTVAGTGNGGFSGENVAATTANLLNPSDVFVDSNNNIYIADTGNNLIRRVSSTGTITRVAGTGEPTYGGDDNPALEAQLNHPIGIVVDRAGVLYICDSQNHRIRRVATDGKITTFAGLGVPGYTGDGGAATSAAINTPRDIALDASGNFYIADSFNHVVRKITGTTITTLAGNTLAGYGGDEGPATSASLNYPKGVAVDANGVVFIADAFNARVRAVYQDGSIRTVAGNGQIGESGDSGAATRATLRFPDSVASGASGRVVVADSQNNRVRQLSLMPGGFPTISSGGVIGSVAFGGLASATPGGWLEIYGTNLGSNTRGWRTSDFNGPKAPTVLDATEVTIGGRRAFVSYISPNQVNVQVPSEVALGQQEVRVTTESGTSAAAAINVKAASPGLLAPREFRINDKQYVVAFAADGTYVSPPGILSGVPSRVARPGETIVLYGVGFGPVSPSVPAGEITRQLASIAQPFEVYFGDTQAGVYYAGLVPGTVGLFQINVTVPDVAASNEVPLSFRLGGVQGEQVLYTAVGN